MTEEGQSSVAGPSWLSWTVPKRADFRRNWRMATPILAAAFFYGSFYLLLPVLSVLSWAIPNEMADVTPGALASKCAVVPAACIVVAGIFAGLLPIRERVTLTDDRLISRLGWKTREFPYRAMTDVEVAPHERLAGHWCIRFSPPDPQLFQRKSLRWTLDPILHPEDVVRNLRSKGVEVQFSPG